jgi:hypothetical protein
MDESPAVQAFIGQAALPVADNERALERFSEIGRTDR